MPRPPNLGAAEKSVIAVAASKHRKIAGCFCDSPEALAASLELGYRSIVCLEEDVVLLDGSANARKWIDRATRERLGPQA